MRNPETNAAVRVLPAVHEMLDVSARPQTEHYAEDPQVRSLVAAAQDRFGWIFTSCSGISRRCHAGRERSAGCSRRTCTS
jgi:hypothetical protein